MRSTMQRFYGVALLGLWLAPIGCGGNAPSATPGAAGIGGAEVGLAGATATAGNFGSGGSSVGSGGGTSGSAAGTAGGGGRSFAAGMGGVGGTGRSGASGTAGVAAAGGASGAAGTVGLGGTGGGGAAFKPCPDTGDCKILPLGDSITDGLSTPGGYRIPLFHLALMNGKKITFVGGSMNGPMTVDGQPFPPNHEGHSGWTISQIDGIVPDPALKVAPHIVLLHIGTNDMYMSPAGAPDRLGTLIDQIVVALPDALLVVAKIIPLSSGASAVDTFNAAVPAVVQKRADAGKHVLLVDQFTGFPTAELADGVHPNPAGYSRMADKWYAAISSDLH